MFRALKFEVDHVTWPRPFQGHFVVRRLRLAMINLRIKFDMSTITCNKNIKGNAKICKNSRFQPPLGDLGETYTVYLWLIETRMVDFRLVIIEHFSLALVVQALWADICRNRCVQKGVGQFERKFQEGGCPTTTLGVRNLKFLSYHVALFAWSYV